MIDALLAPRDKGTHYLIDGAMSRFVMGDFASFDRALSWISNQSESHIFGGKNF
jgi:hypothetical protein